MGATMKILHIDSSITGEPSVSRQLTARLVGALVEAHPGANVVHRDLDADPLPHLDGKALAAMMSGTATQEPLDEFLTADVIVVGAPMYNFGVPSQLKAWIDRIAVAGKTFRYTEKGPEGLAGGKKVIVASSRGGFYAPGTAQAAYDFQETYLRAVFQFLGIGDIQVVRAEGIAIGPEQRAAALNGAFQSVAAVAQPYAPPKAA
jgi:FMN-dependent NADH-azoreductase